jgi:transposase-like protein
MKNEKIECIRCNSDNVFKFYLHKSKPRFKCRDCEMQFDYDEYYKFIGESPLDKWIGKK